MAHQGLQIIGMSATLPNLKAVAEWLDARLYVTDFRPVTLRQYVKSGRDILDERQAVVRTMQCDAAWEKQDPDHVALLCQETISIGRSVLIFCASKKHTELCARNVARLLTIPERQMAPKGTPGAGAAGGGGDATSDGAPGSVGGSGSSACREAIVAELERLMSGDSAELAKLVSRGVAFHHAGLTQEERELIEAGYKGGAISVLCATVRIQTFSKK